MRRLLICLFCTLIFGSKAQAQGVAAKGPNGYVAAQEALADGRAVVSILEIYCKGDKTGVFHVDFDALTGEVVRNVFVPLKVKGKCDPKKMLARAKREIGTPFQTFQTAPQPIGLTSDARWRERRPVPSGAGPPTQNGLEPKWIYLSDHYSINSIEVIDPETSETLASIEVHPRLIGGMAFSPSGERLYATLWRSTTATPPLPGQVAIVDTTTNRIVDRITLTPDSLPTEPAVSIDGKFLYFTDLSNLVIVDIENKTVAQTIPASAAGGATNQLRSLALSPDGGLICVTDSFGIALLETRTRTFVGRVNISLPNREMPPVFHPDGSKIYIIERRSVSGALAVWLVAIDTSTLTEAGRVTLPGQFDPRNLVITPDGLSLAMDGFLRPTGQPAKAVFILVDTTTNTVVATKEPAEPTVGALGVILR